MQGETADQTEPVAILRAVPPSRMLDYGLAFNDSALMIAAAQVGRWVEVAEEIADRRLDEAATLERCGKFVEADSEREFAAAAYNIAQLAFNDDSARRTEIYAKANRALRASISSDSPLHRVELTDATGVTSYGWEMRSASPIGAVVVIGGLSGWGLSFLGLARALHRRDISTILAEGPGQGETRMRSGLHLSRSTLPGFIPFIELASTRSPHLALVGFSFGGLIAAHLAAQLESLAALVVNCAPVRLGVPQTPIERAQVSAAFGLGDKALEAAIADFCFDPVEETINCPTLILEGGADRLVPPGVQIGFLGESGADRSDVAIRTWADGLHTLYNHADERNALIADWLSERFSTAQVKA